MYPIEKYKFYQDNDRIIAVTTYCGQTVRGVAKCSPADNFDEFSGKKLAALRCDVKVNQKRVARLHDKADKLAQEILALEQEYFKLYHDWDEARYKLKDIEKECREFENRL